MNEFMSFRKFVTPAIIQIIFWILTVGAVIAALGTMFTQSFFGGLIALIVGPLFIRVWCELVILLFRIYDELVAIRTGTSPGAPGFPVTTDMPSTQARAY